MAALIALDALSGPLAFRETLTFRKEAVSDCIGLRCHQTSDSVCVSGVYAMIYRVNASDLEMVQVNSERSQLRPDDWHVSKLDRLLDEAAKVDFADRAILVARFQLRCQR